MCAMFKDLGMGRTARVKQDPGESDGLDSGADLAAHHHMRRKACHFMVELIRRDDEDFVMWTQRLKGCGDHFAVRPWLVGQYNAHRLQHREMSHHSENVVKMSPGHLGPVPVPEPISSSLTIC